MKNLPENGVSRPMFGTHPTHCHPLGWLMPKNVEGGIVYEALEIPDWYLKHQ